MDFYKYQAAGNDFVLVTSMAGRTDIAADEVIRLCDRRYGIGADGLIILEGSRDYDFAMRFTASEPTGSSSWKAAWTMTSPCGSSTMTARAA